MSLVAIPAIGIAAVETAAGAIAATPPGAAEQDVPEHENPHCRPDQGPGLAGHQSRPEGLKKVTRHAHTLPDNCGLDMAGGGA